MWKILNNSNPALVRQGSKLTLNNVRLSAATRAAAYSSSAQSDFLHESMLPTDHFQRSLPRLPIPKLEDTCQHYLNSQRVILSDVEYAHTESVVRSFEKDEGPKLQSMLKSHDKQNKHTSYISGPWFDMYLSDRVPLVLNYNPFIAFTHDPNPAYNDQLIRGTNFIVSSLRFMKTLRANILEPDVFHINPKESDNEKFRKFVKRLPKAINTFGAYWYKAFPLDMSQYGKLFNSTRIPRLQKDELFTNTSARNMLVMRNGHFYSFDVLNEDGSIKPADEIMANLKYIQSQTTSKPEFPVAYLSSENRDVWAGVREKLIAAGNEEILQKIDGALFNLVLDDGDSEDPKELSKMFLYGDGSNRWFDKSFSVIMTRGGKAAVNFEHAWGDGVAVLRYFNEVFKDTSEKPHVHPDTIPAQVDSAAAVRRLDFQLDDGIKSAVREAEKKFNASVSRLDLSFLQHEGLGKNFLKKEKLSPDSFMQLLIQMAYYRQSGGDTVATYESCSTAAFRHGRTETIRPATAATQRVCRMMERGEGGTKASLAEIRAALEECSAMHGALTKNAAMGKGFDRHLFGLRHTAEEAGMERPALYRDPAYAKINHNILSTSTLSSPAVIIGGFAPVVPDGYGVGYAIENEQLGFMVTSYPERNVSDFLQCAQDSVNDLAKVLSGQDFRS